MISADYSQMEMRILAHLCNDVAMVSLFLQEGDIYKLLAGQIFNKSTEEIMDEERAQAKTICLGMSRRDSYSINIMIHR